MCKLMWILAEDVQTRPAVRREADHKRLPVLEMCQHALIFGARTQNFGMKRVQSVQLQ